MDKMSVTVYSKPIPVNIKDKIIDDNFVKLLEDLNQDYIKKELEMDK